MLESKNNVCDRAVSGRVILTFSEEVFGLAKLRLNLVNLNVNYLGFKT